MEVPAFTVRWLPTAAGMIRFLNISNLAVIDHLDVEFRPGLNVLTGETGAGKSIVVEAVGLLLGGRASPDLIRTGETTASIQAVFERPGGDELIVRREISDSGRSRAFVNGTLATAAALKDLARELVDLHGQHEHQVLLDPDSHLDLLDEFARLMPQRERVASTFESVHALRERLARSRLHDTQRAERLDLLTFQLAELDRAAPTEGEDESLQATRQVLANAEKLDRLCAEAYSLLYERDDAALAQLGGVWRRVGELAALDATFGTYLDARDSVKSQLEDLAHTLRAYRDTIDASPQRLQDVDERLALLERVKRKHGPTLADVIARRAALRDERRALEQVTEQAGELEAALDAAAHQYLDAATTLSSERRAVARRFAGEVERALGELAMERTRFEVRFETGEGHDIPPEQWTARGIDRGQFFASPNPGEELRPLARIASGGELSRVMLALRALASTGSPGKTLVFDEVDAGIGGRVADVVGRKLGELGRRYQVLCVTHLPQIASRATTHFTVAKRVMNSRTTALVSRVDGDARAEELARMLAGAEVSEGLRAGARELLRAGQAMSEQKPKGESERRKRR